MPRFFVDANIAAAKTLSADFYTDAAVFELCKEKIFAASWQFIGDTGLVKAPGDIYPFTFLDGCLNEPLVLTRDKQDQINLLSNVCTHRGNLVANKACNIPALRCGYHGRLFHLDGKFISMPEFREVHDFPSKQDDLPSIDIFRWGNWLFSSLTNTYPAIVFFREMMERIGWMPVADFEFRPDMSREYTIHAHWALYCENYLEGFHIPFVHAGLNSVIDFKNYTTELFGFSNLQVGIAKDAEDCFDLPETSPDHGKKIAAYYFFIFPNLMFNFYPWGLSVNIVIPRSLEETSVVFLAYVWDQTKLGQGAGAGLNEVELEDEEVVESVQKGVRSRFYTHGRYSVTREQGTHHFHRLIADFLK